MSTPRPLLLLLGSGARIGTLTAQRFAQNGYNVAVVSRSGTDRRNENGFLSIKADLTDPKSIPRVFAAAKAEFGTGPSVVVYNVYSMAPLPEKDTLLSITVGSFVKDLNANTVSAFAAASEAVRVWNKMPESTARKAFIFTGNIQNVRHVPGASLATIGAGKAATAYWIGSAAAAYSGKGYK
jgi:NAD(P)-dependent dehydrogenase (short-subunit alcohol dehydrogenase family)